MSSTLYWLSIGLYLSGFIYFTYFCIIADPDDSSTADFWTRRLPDILSSRLSQVIGSKNVKRLELASEYALQLIYLVVVLVAWSVVFAYVYPWIPESNYVSNYHRYVGVAVFVACMSSWRYACNVSPGIISNRTLAKFDNYAYDHLLFVPDRICPTVGIPKLARSKYDRFSKGHVARFDHFCGWLHNPVGEENYRYFLLFLLVHVCMCVYGVSVVSLLFHGEIVNQGLLEATFFNVQTGEEFKGSWFIIAQYMLGRHFYVSFVWFLMVVMSVCLGAFLGYHVWLTSVGMTTNESAKWAQVKKWHKDEVRRYQEAVKNGLVGPQVKGAASTPSGPVVPDGDIGCTGAVSSSGESASSTGTHNASQNDPIADPGPYPKNIYDFGFVENWKDVLSPRSLRPDAMERWKSSLREQKIRPDVKLAERETHKSKSN